MNMDVMDYAICQLIVVGFLIILYNIIDRSFPEMKNERGSVFDKEIKNLSNCLSNKYLVYVDISGSLVKALVSRKLFKKFKKNDQVFIDYFHGRVFKTIFIRRLRKVE